MAMHSNKNSVTGKLEDYTGGVIPFGRLLSYGQALNAVANPQYLRLYNIIGIQYGGSGMSNFLLPDTRGLVTAGLDNLGGVARGVLTGVLSGIAPTTLGSWGGSERHLQTTGEMPAHSHSIADPSHSHSLNDPGHQHGLAQWTSWTDSFGYGSHGSLAVGWYYNTGFIFNGGEQYSQTR